MNRNRRAAALLAALSLTVPLPADEPGKPPAEERVAGPEGLTVAVRVQGPYAAAEPLQVVCYFQGDDGRSLSGAPVELDEKFGGVIAALRGRGEFAGEPLETLLLETRGKIPAARLLLIGLGKERDLSPDLMAAVGRTAYREAARLGVEEVAFAPMIRDQGSKRLSAAEVAGAVVRGVLLARDTDLRLQKEGLARPYRMRLWVEEAGPKYFAETVAAAKDAVSRAAEEAGRRSREPFGRE